MANQNLVSSFLVICHPSNQAARKINYSPPYVCSAPFLSHLILADFQRLYTPSAFRAERILWRSVIQLNVVRSVRTILDAISSVPPPIPTDTQSPTEDFEEDPLYVPHELELIKLRLSPLHHVEALLIAKLIPPSQDDAWAPIASTSTSGAPIIASYHHHHPAYHHRPDHRWRPSQEVFVRPSATSWKGALAKSFPFSAGPRPNSIDDDSTTTATSRDEAQQVLHACCGDITVLWNDPFVRDVLRRRKIRLEESPGLSVFSFLSRDSVCMTFTAF